MLEKKGNRSGVSQEEKGVAEWYTDRSPGKCNKRKR